MGGFSVFHWIILLLIVGVPLVLALIFSRRSRNTTVNGPQRGTTQVPSENTPMNWTQTFFSISGRIGRGKWWVSHLIQWVPILVVVLIASAMSSPDKNADLPPWAVILFLVWYVLLVWTSICINAKRWHDRDKSGWWQLIGAVPLIGIWALIENGFLRGTDGQNRFGPNPLNRP